MSDAWSRWFGAEYLGKWLHVEQKKLTVIKFKSWNCLASLFCNKIMRASMLLLYWNIKKVCFYVKIYISIPKTIFLLNYEFNYHRPSIGDVHAILWLKTWKGLTNFPIYRLTVHSALCTVHCALCTVHCALSTVHCALAHHWPRPPKTTVADLKLSARGVYIVLYIVLYIASTVDFTWYFSAALLVLLQWALWIAVLEKIQCTTFVGSAMLTIPITPTF